LNLTALDLPPHVARDLDRLAELTAARRPEIGAAASTAEWLYAHWYTEAAARSPPPHRDLRPGLRAGLAASRHWSPGWVVVESRDDGSCVAGKGPEVRRLAPGDYANLARPFMPAMPGDHLAVVARNDWSDPQTGFWHAQSPAGSPQGDLVRLYVSAGAAQAAACLELLTACLDRAAARYALKCPGDAALFERHDSLVVYLEEDAWPALEPRIVRKAAALALPPERPPLTRSVSQGLSFAEDPGGGRSFGELLCQVLAPAVLAMANGETPASRASLAEALRTAGIDPAAPWKRPRP